jgi:DNA-binding MarR family transcriptional regulator
MLLPRRSDKDDLRQALDALRRIVRVLRLSSTELDRSVGLSVAQLFVLEQLSDGQPRSIRELAELTLTDPSSVSVVVARLVERKLIARRVDREDARRARLSITAAGRAVLGKAPEPVQARLLSSMKKLPARRLRDLAATLAALAQAVGAPPAELFFEPPSAGGRR